MNKKMVTFKFSKIKRVPFNVKSSICFCTTGYVTLGTNLTCLEATHPADTLSGFIAQSGAFILNQKFRMADACIANWSARDSFFFEKKVPFCFCFFLVFFYFACL
jgi:hypothetical protein